MQRRPTRAVGGRAARRLKSSGAQRWWKGSRIDRVDGRDGAQSKVWGDRRPPVTSLSPRLLDTCVRQPARRRHEATRRTARSRGEHSPPPPPQLTHVSTGGGAPSLLLEESSWWRMKEE
eukprot:scaffold18420_cov56-Phaeocystis_antarctica.AAC.3